MFRSVALAVPAVLLLLAFAGCGGGGSDSSPSTTTQTETVTVESGQPLSKADFIARADAICSAAKEEVDGLDGEIQELSDSASSSSDLAKLAGLFRKAADSTQGEVDQIRDLEPPSADQEIINQMLSTVDAEISQINEAADAVENSDEDELNVLGTQIKTTAAKAKGIAQGYGFKVCGSDK